MDARQSSPRVPAFRIRVLIIGRANAGKTCILQRVGDTTESDEIYRDGPHGIREKVHRLDASIERGEHNIEDEFIFANNKNFVFHDAPGIEAGDDRELKIAQDFVRRKSQERRFADRLHVIWYCVPMDNNRTEENLRLVEDFCRSNVPVIVVFTKYEYFKREISFKLEDNGRDPTMRLELEAERIFCKHCLGGLREPRPFVRLQRMHEPGQKCTELIELTIDTLANGFYVDIYILKTLAAQEDNMERNVIQANEQ